MRQLALYSLILTGACAAFACSKSDTAENPVAREHVQENPGTSLSVSVTFPSDAVKGVTNSVHVFVLGAVPGGDAATFNCGDLVGRLADPYGTNMTRAADLVAKSGFDTITVDNVAPGGAFVYVEAVDYGGQVDWAGCVPLSGASAAVTLTRAGVYDCQDSHTKEGAPCDDGKVCTVGEVCKAGTCQNGLQRDCGNFTDQCNAGTCTEAKGCYAQPLANTTACNDNDECTTGDACNAGKCQGKARDCAAEAGQCEVYTGYCSPYYGCSYTDKPYNTPCEDGQFCTTGDYCGYGTCYSGYNSPCSGTCDNGCNEATRSCTPYVCNNNPYYYDCYENSCDLTYGCYKPKPAGIACTAYGYSTCAQYSTSLVGVPHCNGSGSCIYYSSGSVGSSGCW